MGKFQKLERVIGAVFCSYKQSRTILFNLPTINTEKLVAKNPHLQGVIALSLAGIEMGKQSGHPVSEIMSAIIGNKGLKQADFNSLMAILFEFIAKPELKAQYALTPAQKSAKTSTVRDFTPFSL